MKWFLILLILLLLIYFFYCYKKETFTNTNTNKLNIYNFNTSWCGYSTSFQPVWDEFTDQMHNLFPNVNVIDVKCDNNNQLCDHYKIPGFPYVLFEYNDQQEPYTGPRTIDSLMNKVNEIMSTLA